LYRQNRGHTLFYDYIIPFTVGAHLDS